MDDAARIEGLEAENERLRGRLAQLETEKGLDLVPPIEWRLTPYEARVLGALLTRPQMTKQAMMDTIYRGAIDEPEIKIVDVFICKLRKKLAPYDLPILTLWGRGYYMEPATQTRAKALIEVMSGRAA